jgi:hypothetical protein
MRFTGGAIFSLRPLWPLYARKLLVKKIFPPVNQFTATPFHRV